MPQSNQDKIRILIVGAGKAGELIGENIARNADSPFQVIGYVDDDKKKQGKKASRYPVLGYGKDLGPLCQQYNIEEVFIAIPSERGNTVRGILENTLGMKLVYKILPRSSEVLMQDFKGDYMQYVRKLRLED